MSTLGGVTVQIENYEISSGSSIEIRPRAGTVGKIFNLGGDAFRLSLSLILVPQSGTLDELQHSFLSMLENAKINQTKIELSGLNAYLDGYYFVQDYTISREYYSSESVIVQLVRESYV